MVFDSWKGCYSRGWGKELTPDAYAHPAKVSFMLADRIYRHLIETGRVKAGDTVLDPFGGIAGFAYHALFNGLHWIGCELEPKFHQLGQENIALWNSRYRGWPKWGTAVLLNGDSRYLRRVVSDCCSVIVSSPPFVGSGAEGDGRKALMTNAWNANPENADKPGFRPNLTGDYQRASHADTYGTSPGQLGGMKEGQIADVVVSSPPYEEGLGHGGTKPIPMLVEKNLHSALVNNGYGGGQGNLSNHSGETFWTAARQIVSECFHLLRPGGVAVWVCKDFVRKGKIVPFCEQWRQLCESCGFVTICQHRAMLISDSGDQLTLFGDPEQLIKKRASFFRRLAESKGSPKIDWETVYCMEKPT